MTKHVYKGTKTSKRCPKCDEVLPVEKFPISNQGHMQSYCRDCYVRRYQQAKADAIVDKTAAAQKKFDDWMELTKNLKKTPLTEAQWLEACRYFKGCAICGDKHIETRDFFIRFKDGGLYTAWNVIPLCAKCSEISRSDGRMNPFELLDPYLRKVGNEHRYRFKKDVIENITTFLKRQVAKCQD